jgi:hypothetical protein
MHLSSTSAIHQVSLEHIKSPPTLPAKDTLTVAADALALPCFKSDVLRELTANTCAKAETSSDVCSPTVNSMASMFATHATVTAGLALCWVRRMDSILTKAEAASSNASSLCAAAT